MMIFTDPLTGHLVERAVISNPDGSVSGSQFTTMDGQTWVGDPMTLVLDGARKRTLADVTSAQLLTYTDREDMPADVVFDEFGQPWTWPFGAPRPRKLNLGEERFDPAEMQSDVVDFRTQPDLTQLGIINSEPVVISPNSISGRVTGNYGADGLDLTTTQVGWRGMLGFRRLGYEVASTARIEIIVNPRGDQTYAMCGVAAWEVEPKLAPELQGYYAGHMVYVQRASATTVRTQRLYSGLRGNFDDQDPQASEYVTSSVNAAGAFYNDGPYGRWFRITFDGGGGVGAQAKAQVIDPALAATADDLFTSAVDIGPPSIWNPGTARGLRDKYAYPAIALHRADNNLTLMAMKIG